MPPVFFPTPAHLRKWLEKNHKKKDELWIGMYKTHSGKKSVTWPEVVDQALCFGWIDGIRKSIDEISYMNRITPRRATSIWSTKNINRFKELQELGLITPAGQAAFDAKKDSHTNRYSFEQASVTLLPEYAKKLKANKKAWRYFQTLPPSKQRPSIWWVMSAKQKATQLRRLENLIASSAKGEKIAPLNVNKKS